MPPIRRPRIGGASLVTAGRVLMIASMLLLLPLAIVTIVWIFDVLLAPPVLQYLNSPVPTKQQSVTAGQAVTLIIERCAQDPFAPDPLIYTYTRELVSVGDGTTTGLQQGSSSMSHGCQSGDNAWQDASNTVPRSIDPGTYYIRGTATALGRLKVSYVLWQSQPFDVLPPPVAPGVERRT